MEQWEKDLREEIRGALTSPVPPDKPKKKIQIRPFLFFVAVLLFLMNFVVLEQKHPGYLATKISQARSFFDDKVEQPPAEDPLVTVLREFDARIAGLENKDYKDEELTAELKELRNKVYLLVIVSDENAAISKKILRKYDYEAREFLHIDPDWKIDRMPTHIKLTPDSEEFLRKRLK
tara:strand:- start:42 stop:572 length:531 start_codon:yes stop_codon:yes gene_type:complete